VSDEAAVVDVLVGPGGAADSGPGPWWLRSFSRVYNSQTYLTAVVLIAELVKFHDHRLTILADI
jgi:hypothetical protein